MPEYGSVDFKEKCEHGVHEGDECDACDDLYRGVRRERRRHKIITNAVAAADRIVLDSSSGDTEETDYLTAAVMRLFMEKTFGRIHAQLHHHDMAEDASRMRKTRQ
jgi:uncharacterized protein YycO